MPTQLEETQAAIDLISGCLIQIKAARDELKTLVQQVKNEYLSSSNKDEKKPFSQMIESIEKEANFNETIAGANELIHMLDARLNEAKSNHSKVSRRLGLLTKSDY